MRILAILTLILSSIAAFAAEKKTEVFTLDHQMSQSCEKRIKENLRFEKGIDKIEVSLEQNTITITYNPSKTDTDKIIAGFKKIGFNAFLAGQPQECETPAEAVPAGCCGGCGGGSCGS